MDIKEMDGLAARIIEVQAEIAELEDQIDVKKESIKSILKRVEEYYVETGREHAYVAPKGTLYLTTITSIRQPTAEQRKLIHAFNVEQYGEEVAMSKLTYNAASLKSDVVDYYKQLAERGGDPILEPFPGIEPPTKTKKLVFKRGKQNVA